MKKLKLGIGLVMVIVLGCWIASRWHTWFVEEGEVFRSRGGQAAYYVARLRSLPSFTLRLSADHKG